MDHINGPSVRRFVNSMTPVPKSKVSRNSGSEKDIFMLFEIRQEAQNVSTLEVMSHELRSKDTERSLEKETCRSGHCHLRLRLGHSEWLAHMSSRVHRLDPPAQKLQTITPDIHAC